jgi:hypothetical protein
LRSEAKITHLIQAHEYLIDNYLRLSEDCALVADMLSPKSNCLPGWNRDPAKEYFRLYQNPSEDKIAAFKAIRCPVCWPITRDLGVFSRYLENLKPDQGAILEWPIRLSELADTAEAGCQLCRFMAVKFFFRSGIVVFGRLEMDNGIACCSASHAVEKTSEIEAAVEKLRNFCGRFPDVEFGMVVEPIDWVREEAVFGRIRVSVSTTKNLKDEQAVAEILNHNSEIVLEIYATEGIFRPSSLLLFKAIKISTSANIITFQRTRQPILSRVDQLLPIPHLIKA